MQLEWHPDARKRLEERLQQHVPAVDPEAEARRASLVASVERELDQPGRAAVTVADVDAAFEAVLARERASSAGPAESGRPLGPGKFVWFCLACIFGPAIVLAIEVATRMCANELFDPLPTRAHELAVAFVPVAGAFALFSLHGRPRAKTQGWASLGLGAAIAISFFYFLVFLPVLPAAVLALVMGGLGLLPLTPIVCFPSLCLLAVALVKRPADPRRRLGPRIAIGILAGLLAFAAIEAPALLSRRWIMAATRGEPTERAAALEGLRTIGSKELLVRLASGAGDDGVGPLGVLFGGGDPVTAEEAREVWYRVHGELFRGPLLSRGARIFGREVTPFGLDPETGGTTVGRGEAALELRSSRLDAAVDGTAGVAYVEWVLELANEGFGGALEGRALVELPDEAVVSRATLWVGDEEREAAYASTSATRAAYQRVAVLQRRDPLLVTSAGDDLVLAQAFPVSAGRTLKWKLGITVPLVLEGQTARIPLPRLLDRNFRLAHGLAHGVWIQSHEELASPALAVQKIGDRYEARGDLRADALEARGTPPQVSVRRDDVGSVELALEDGRRLVCSFEPAPRAQGAAPVVVVSGSRALRAFREAIQPALREAFPGSNLTVFVANDVGVERVELGPDTPGRAIEDAAGWDGGVDEIPAIGAAWDRARELGAGIVWLAGPQPLLLSSSEPLAQRFEREPGGPRVGVLPLVPGENRFLVEFARDARIEHTAFDGSVADALRRAHGAVGILRRWHTVEGGTPGGRAGPKHLAALAASAQVEELLRATPPRGEEALGIAARNHLVTRVSGAVVLETAEQFAQSGLSPAEAESLPTVPEPESIVLAGVALVAVIVGSARRRKPRFA